MTDEALGYTLWAVLRRDGATPAGTGDLAPAIAAVEAAGVTIRGFYDVSSMRADADLMIWMHGEKPETLQWALRELRRSEPLKSLLPTWNAMGVHREAEFTRSHVPAFLRGKEPEAWLTVYPFVRSYEWYLLPDDERKAMLADHGRKGSEYPQVLANTVAAFALGDYEWILPLEAPELVDLVDLMRHLRQTDARLHVREEIPFYTGRRIRVDEIAEVLS
ncbi:chlorite dismutase [Microbacteriaceae bacterium SG_E_30_P1]|uniref:Coproheme decarboxylase n=1 Tax=Antiquaquibacter oligotrophicus TaxID=2880260 RepID=A0ABT6KQJ1_9MICO|nr:hydrogen peroxide-dependent heme synthase [Antiquaquibacter oligotrophicus]MDH6182255.1 chlorite dismutase [Antiquaquibacter oligotrophicus]UDF12087.1 chlorite dismutase family protein [Antiquaquibacter oligotrophicus]